MTDKKEELTELQRVGRSSFFRFIFVVISFIIILVISFAGLISWVWSIPFIIFEGYYISNFFLPFFTGHYISAKVTILTPVIFFIVTLFCGIRLDIILPTTGMMVGYVALIYAVDYRSWSILSFIICTGLCWGAGFYLAVLLKGIV